jgi:hypothetical protein
LTLELYAGQRRLARIGREARPTRLGRWLRVPGSEIGWYAGWLAVRAYLGRG